MCVAAFSFGPGSGHRIVFAANRDELHARPTAAAAWWDDAPDVLGGRDLVAGGTWLAINRRGWLAAITNLPQDEPRPFPRSRGTLAREFLTDARPARAHAADFEASKAYYGPCNVVFWDGHELYYAATTVEAQRLEPGIHVLGNAVLGADWPRMQLAKTGFEAALDADEREPALFRMLADRDAPPIAADVPAHGLNGIFIINPRYGTRSSTVVSVELDGSVAFTERSFAADGDAVGEQRYRFTLADQT